MDYFIYFFVRLKVVIFVNLPYDLFSLDLGETQFVLQFLNFHEQDDYSIQVGGLSGDFGIFYKDKAFSCRFRCDITVGNLYDFYIALDNAWDILGCREGSSAVLSDYSHFLKRSRLSVTFDKKGHCSIEGSFKSKESAYQSGIFFSFQADQTYISENLNSLDYFLHELAEMQGHRNFY